jgi:Tol biopolymer transport system component
VSVEYSARHLRGWLVWIAVALAFAAVARVALEHAREVPPPRPSPVRTTWTMPDTATPGAGPEFPFGLVLAPDGRRALFPSVREGRLQLWMQDLQSGSLSAIPGTEGGTLPFWSPDGARIGFFAGGALRSLELTSGQPHDALEVASPRGASWNARGDLVVAATAEGGLTLRSPDGATRALTSVDAGAGEIAHLFPTFLPDGNHVLFFVRASQPARQGIWLTPIGGNASRQRLVGGAASGIVAGDQLVFANDGALVAQALDVEQARLAGRATVLGVSVGQSPLGQLLATAADDVLIYSPPVSTARELVWVTRAGERLGNVGSPTDMWQARIAPDGRRVVATVLEPLLRTLDVVLFDGSSVMPTRVSLSIDTDETPAWSPDGLRVGWVSAGHAVTVRGAGAVLPADTIARFDEAVRVNDWMPDGRGLIVTRTMPDTREDLWLVPTEGNGEPRALIATPFADVQGAISPDGRWMAYASDESGQFDIYVERVQDRYPGPGTRERVSSGGGSDPRWSRDGQELFFRRGSQIHAAMPALGRGQNALAATSMVFDTKVGLRTFDVAPDGRRFLLNLPASSASAGPATLIVSWPRGTPAPPARR